MTIPAYRVVEIEHLLAAKVSQRQIAVRTGIGRATIGEIALGRRPARSTGAPDPDALVAAHRCGGCGALINTRDCIACRATGIHGAAHKIPARAA